MKLLRFGVVLTVLNLVLLAILLAHGYSAGAESVPPVLRGRALEIVDDKGRTRASISVEPPVTMEGRAYPETVLLRLTDPKNGPVVKITASDEGSVIGLSDDAEGGVQIHSTKQKGNFVRVVDRDGKEKIVKP